MGSFEERNAALCRKDLDGFQADEALLLSSEPVGRLCWLKVAGIADFWETNRSCTMPSLQTDLLAGLSGHESVFAYFLRGSADGFSVYLGVKEADFSPFSNSVISIYPGITVEKDEDICFDTRFEHGGAVTGIPTLKLEEGCVANQIENIFRGLIGQSFEYLVLAKGLSPFASTLANSILFGELEQAYASMKQTYFGGAQGNVSAERLDYRVNEYLENLALEQGYLREAMGIGLWQVGVYFSAEDESIARLLGNIIRATYSGEDSKPEPIRITELPRIESVIREPALITIPSPVYPVHPLGALCLPNGSSVDLCSRAFVTIMTSSQVATMSQLPTKEFPGYYVDNYVEFDTASRASIAKEKLEIGHIRNAGRGSIGQVINNYTIPLEDLTRHTLVIGVTGGGKTNTSKSILNKLWNPAERTKRIPFMVIESAKREYWQLRELENFEDLLVFTMGDEATKTAIPYRLNPFEANSGVSLQTHIDYLLSTFNAAFELYPPMPYVLETAVYEVYEDLGWDIVENENYYGLTNYPTLEDLFNKIDVVVNRLGYDSEVQSNVKAALKARIGSLMIGGKGLMLNTRQSIPLSQLLDKPVVLELEDLGDDETKSFVIGMLLVQLYEYRKAYKENDSDGFSHLLLVEEAHRLLKNVPEVSGGSNTRAKSVEFFCNLLAEIRSYGQGIMIADQIPTKLATDTIKNTNLKIVHRTVAQDDREIIGRAMNMTEEQIGYLSSLPRGSAAVYAEGDNRPKCIQLPLVEPFYRKSRKDVVSEMQNKAHYLTHSFASFDKKNQACSFCSKRCLYSETVKNDIIEKIPDRQSLLKIWDERNYTPLELRKIVLGARDRGFFDDPSFDSELCFLGYLLELACNLTPGDRELILAKYLRNYHPSKKES